MPDPASSSKRDVLMVDYGTSLAAGNLGSGVVLAVVSRFDLGQELGAVSRATSSVGVAGFLDQIAVNF